MKIIGMRVENYIGESCTESETFGFVYAPDEFKRYVIYALLSSDGYKGKHPARTVEITLWHTEGMCGSGYTTASWGHIKVREVKQAGVFSYYPKEDLIVDDLWPNQTENFYHEEGFAIENDVFSMSHEGGCGYYPSGYVRVDMSKFIRGIRTVEKRPVWIFLGSSNSGKSYLSSKLSDLEVYETDSANELPEVITADIVVLGNKYRFDVNAIQERLFGDVLVQIVSFL